MNRTMNHTRRGSALMMVITAMATGVVLSTAYVASRTNGTVIGSNLAASSQARVNAESSLALTVAALSSDDQWRTSHVDGLLFETFEDGDSTEVRLTDLATGESPDESTVDIRAVVTTTVDDIKRTAEADFFVALPEQAGAIVSQLAKARRTGEGTRNGAGLQLRAGKSGVKNSSSRRNGTTRYCPC